MRPSITHIAWLLCALALPASAHHGLQRARRRPERINTGTEIDEPADSFPQLPRCDIDIAAMSTIL